MNPRTKFIFVSFTVLLTLVLAVGGAIGMSTKAQESEPESGGGPSYGPGTSEVSVSPPGLQGTGVEGFTPAWARPETEPELVSAWLRIPGTTLKPRESDVQWGVGGNGGSLYVTSGDMYTWFNTAVYLPHGSTVTMMRVYVKDNAASNSQGYFTIYDLFGNIVTEWGASSSGITGDDWFDVTIPSVGIDYSSYSYVVNWQAGDTGNDTVLHGFRLYYSPPPGFTFLPNILRTTP